MANLRNEFAFTDRERYGLIVLAVLILLSWGGIWLQGKLTAPPQTNFAAFDRDIQAMQEAQKTIQPTQEYKTNTSDFKEEAIAPRSVVATGERFFFNPNELPEADWIRLGLSPKQAKSIKKFEAKGGHFYRKEDLKKMFVISPDFYARIEEFIVIPESNTSENKTVTAHEFPEKKIKQQRKIELNAADSSALLDVSGIGPVFAKRIVAYRKRLGGFHAPEQLLEVFGFDQERLDQVSTAVSIDSSYIQKININTASAADFKKHPYIAPSVAHAVVNYRKQHGPFESVEAIQGCVLVNADLYRKLAVYLTI
ncbi:MAG: helix-hairpin-helix domain-containing protein [Bacteroidia bacterium]